MSSRKDGVRARAGFDQPEEVEPIERMRSRKGDRLLAVKTSLLPGKIGRAVDGEDVLARPLVEAQPRLGRLQAVRRSAEKLDAERPLEVVDGVTRPRSGNAEALGRAAHALEFQGGDEGAKRAEAEAHERKPAAGKRGAPRAERPI